MATYQTEFFGHIIYSPELSYEDLLLREDEVKAAVQQVLLDNGGEYLNFEALGDTLRVQGMFPAGDEDFFQSICAGIAPQLVRGITGRLLFVDKDLSDLYFYALRDGLWQESAIGLPEPGFLDPLAESVTVPEIVLKTRK